MSLFDAFPSSDGIQKLPIPPATAAFQDKVCGSDFGIEGMLTIASALVSELHIHFLSSASCFIFNFYTAARQQPFVLEVYTNGLNTVESALDNTDNIPNTGFNMEYTQVHHSTLLLSVPSECKLSMYISISIFRNAFYNLYPHLF